MKKIILGVALAAIGCTASQKTPSDPKPVEKPLYFDYGVEGYTLYKTFSDKTSASLGYYPEDDTIRLELDHVKHDDLTIQGSYDAMDGFSLHAVENTKQKRRCTVLPSDSVQCSKQVQNRAWGLLLDYTESLHFDEYHDAWEHKHRASYQALFERETIAQYIGEWRVAPDLAVSTITATSGIEGRFSDGATARLNPHGTSHVVRDGVTIKWYSFDEAKMPNDCMLAAYDPYENRKLDTPVLTYIITNKKNAVSCMSDIDVGCSIDPCPDFVVHRAFEISNEYRSRLNKKWSDSIPQPITEDISIMDGWK